MLEIDKAIDEFDASWDLLNMKTTVKSHIIKFHLSSFMLERNSSLGFFSEQASESLHFDFKSCWSKFKVDSANSMYSSNLLRAVSVYNSGHF